MLLQEGIFEVLKHRISFLEDLYEKDDKERIIKNYLRQNSINGRIRGENLERFLASKLKCEGKIFLNVKFECNGLHFEYDIVTVLPNGDCDYIEVKWNVGDINVLMEPRSVNGKTRFARDVEMRNLFGKDKYLISATPLEEGDIFPEQFEFKNIYFVSLKNNLIYPSREREVFFSYLCNLIKNGWYVGKNRFNNRFYFRKSTTTKSPWGFAKNIFKKFIIPISNDFYFKNLMHEDLDEINPDTFFEFSKEEFENEFEEEFKGLVMYTPFNE